MPRPQIGARSATGAASEFSAITENIIQPWQIFFCHAGVRPGVPLENQQQEDLLWIRDEFLNNKMDFGKIIVHGHTPRPVPEVLPSRINVDTGAFATGRLTCAVLERDGHRFLAT
jgi:hypothetical protein